jgi:hypothetical protein
MRVLALITATIGCLLVTVGGFGLYTTITGWDVLRRSGEFMGLQPDHWRGHWLGTAVVYVALGLVFLSFTIGLWRRSRRATVAWCITVSALAIVWLLLFLLQPLPYGFQQIPFGEVAFLVALSAVSWVLCRSQHHAKAI